MGRQSQRRRRIRGIRALTNMRATLVVTSAVIAGAPRWMRRELDAATDGEFTSILFPTREFGTRGPRFVAIWRGAIEAAQQMRDMYGATDDDDDIVRLLHPTVRG